MEGSNPSYFNAAGYWRLLGFAGSAPGTSRRRKFYNKANTDSTLGREDYPGSGR